MIEINFLFIAHRYSCLVIPHSPGAVTDLVTDSDLSEILRHFVKEQSKASTVKLLIIYQKMNDIMFEEYIFEKKLFN